MMRSKKRQAREAEFTKRISANANQKAKYGSLLKDMQEAHQQIEPYQRALDYSNEGYFSVEFIRFSWAFNQLMLTDQAKVVDMKEHQKQLDNLKNAAAAYFKDLNVEVDKRIAVAMFSSVKKGMDPVMLPGVFSLVDKKYKGDFAKYFNEIYAKSMFSNMEKTMAFLNNYKPADWKKISKDQGLFLHPDFIQITIKIFFHSGLRKMIRSIVSIALIWRRKWEFLRIRNFYPDANFTLRITTEK